MAVSKVVVNNETILDLTSDTVTADTLAEGKTAHNAAGEQIVGTMTSGGSSTDVKTQEKTVSPSTSEQVITPDDGYDALSQVTVSAIALQSKSVSPTTSSQTVTPDSDYNGLSEVTVDAVSLQSKTVSPFTSAQTVTPDSSYLGLSQVSVSAIQTETGSATDNGTFSPSSGKYYSQFTVNVAYNTYRTGSGGPYDSLGSDGDLYFDMG